MAALYILIAILGVIGLVVALLSVRFAVTVHYEGDIALSVKWLFLKFDILPKKEKKPKKKKKKKNKKDKKPKKEKDEGEKKPEKEIIKEPKEHDGNMFLNFYKYRGVDGVLQLLKDTVKAIGGLFGRIFRAFRIEELYIAMAVGGGDSAEIAEKYGKICAAAFPAMGLIVNKLNIKKYSIDISPDFIYGNNEAKLHTKISLRPIKLIAAFVVLVIELLYKVVFELLMDSQPPKEEKVEKQVKK